MPVSLRALAAYTLPVPITLALWWVGSHRPFEQGVHSASFHSAACTGDVQTMARLLSQGVNCDTRDEFGRTPLAYAAGFNARSAEWLLARGANVNAAQPHGLSPLMLAVFRSRSGEEPGDADLVGLLLSAGANTETRTHSGITPLIYACGLGHARAAESLLAAGADVRACDLRGRTALAAAAESGDADLVRTLLGAGAETGTHDEEGITPPLAAASAGHVDVVRVLLAAGAAPNAAPF